MFKKIVNYIKEFIDDTPDDIYEFSCDLEGMLVRYYDEMHNEQPIATEILNNDTPDICATAEPGMTLDEINEFKRLLKIEYDKAMKAVV